MGVSEIRVSDLLRNIPDVIDVRATSRTVLDVAHKNYKNSKISRYTQNGLSQQSA
jgi:hypothetical protein